MEDGTLMDLPDDKIFEICETLDDKSLLNFSLSNQRVNQICKVILKKRKEIFTIELLNFLVSFYDGINSSVEYIYRKLYLGFTYDDLIKDLKEFLPDDENVKTLIQEIIDKFLDISKIYNLENFSQNIAKGIAQHINQLIYQVVDIAPVFWLVHYIPDDNIKDYMWEDSEVFIDISEIPEYVDEKLICTDGRPIDIFKRATRFTNEDQVVSGFHPIGKIQGLPALEVYIDLKP